MKKENQAEQKKQALHAKIETRIQNLLTSADALPPEQCSPTIKAL